MTEEYPNSQSDTDDRLLTFLNHFLESYNNLKLKQPHLNTDDILKILAESLNSSVAFIGNPLPPNTTLFNVAYLYKEGDIDLNLGTEFELNQEVIKTLQGSKHYSWEEETLKKYLPDLYSLGLRNLFITKYEGLSESQQILIVGNRKKRPQSESYFYINHEALAAKAFMGLADKEIRFNEYFKSYKEIRRTDSRTALLRAMDVFLNTFESCLRKENIFDKYLFKSLDLKIARQIRPSKIAQREEVQKFLSSLQEATLKSHAMILPKIALIRGFSWLHYKEPKKEWIELINNFDTEIKAISDDVLFQKVGSWESKDPDIPIEDIPGRLNKAVVNSINRFYLQYRLPFEYIRSQLFRIYVECLKQENIAKRDILETINSHLFNSRTTNVLDKLKPMLWEYLSKWEHNDSLIINSDWLKSYLAIKLLDSECLKYYLNKDNLQKGHCTPQETLSFFTHFTTFLLFIIHGVRNHGNPAFLKFSDTEGGFGDVIQAQIYLLSEIAHIDGKLPREIKLFDDTMQIWSSEAILYTASDAYREHLHHTLDCCVLGLVLLDTGIHTKLCPDYKTIWPNSDLLRNWILIGLLHDVGYSFELCHQINQHLEFLNSPQMDKFRLKLDKFLSKLTKELGKGIKKMMPQIQLNTGDKLSHEAISAVHLLYLKKVKKDKLDKKWVADIKIALDAVQKHHLRGGKINPIKEPLSFILLLCDQLQEWNRPRVDSLKLRQIIHSDIIRPERKEIEQNDILSRLRINLNVSEDKIEWRADKLCFELLFNDAGEEGFEPAILWTEKSCNFMKVVKKSLGTDIEIKMVHPLTRTLNEDGLDFKEMDLFKKFVKEQKKTSKHFPLNEWIEVTKDGRKGLQYNPKKCEEFTINLKEVSMLAFSYSPEGLYADYKEWKNGYLNDAREKARK